MNSNIGSKRKETEDLWMMDMPYPKARKFCKTLSKCSVNWLILSE